MRWVTTPVIILDGAGKNTVSNTWLKPIMLSVNWSDFAAGVFGGNDFENRHKTH